MSVNFVELRKGNEDPTTRIWNRQKEWSMVLHNKGLESSLYFRGGNKTVDEVDI